MYASLHPALVQTRSYSCNKERGERAFTSSVISHSKGFRLLSFFMIMYLWRITDIEELILPYLLNSETDTQHINCVYRLSWISTAFAVFSYGLTNSLKSRSQLTSLPCAKRVFLLLLLSSFTLLRANSLTF